jgi:UV DNA damage endonuclease
MFLQPPTWTAHADYIHPFEFIRFLIDTKELIFDVMLEAKAKDLALLCLRQDLLSYAPELADRFDEIGARDVSIDAERPIQESPRMT